MAPVTIKDEQFARFYAHFPQGISQEIADYVTNEVLSNSRYIFTRRFQNFQFGYCTHCQKEYATDEYLKPGRKATCTKCGSECVVKASGMSRKHLYDAAYIVYYEKSVVNPQAIVARGMYVKRDYRGDYYKVETDYRPENLYLFEPGNSEMYWLSTFNGGWVKSDRVRSGFVDYPSIFNKTCSLESVKSAVEGTPYQYSTWEYYTPYYTWVDKDMVKFFDLFTKSPCVEFLTKAGMRYFVTAKLSGSSPTYGAINWKGVKAQEVLRLDAQRIREIREFKGELHPLTLRLQQIVAKDKSKYSLVELQDVAKNFGACFEDLKAALKYTSLRRAVNYIEKQYLKGIEQGRPHDKEVVARTWRDYQRDCVKLELDLGSERILFPSKLHEAHQHTLKQVNDKADELLNAKIRKRNELLSKKYSFEHGDLFIRPAYDATELIDEGKKLEHCVGRYSEDYAKGKTDLLFVRKIAEPDKPFYTMEVQKGVVTQCRGRKNCNMTNEVSVFVEAFKKEKLEKKSKGKPTEKQEVAV
ncbi:PcfJ domain-containing protein [Paenibacillus thermotolerans]|uniref:PcfJ domain-containing protein n=1 Tax=Paenibacillus thermotolerans TaxID=3027807 RepID=UPI002368C71F|nr:MULTISPECIES: PcfJ domain-containing protein [unclassified Paenibacillus]